jgi:hypothetical protein
MNNMNNFDLKKYLAENRVTLNKLNEDKSKKNRFMGVFGPSKEVFQRVIKNIDPSEIEELIKYTESNGDEIERSGKNAWGITEESGENNQSVWQYLDGVLYFINPNYSSIYDDHIKNM